MGLLNSLLYVVWLILAIVYLAIWVAAFQHRVDKSKQFGALSPYWCFEDALYDDQGKRLCRIGKPVSILLVVLFILSLL